MKIDWAKVMIGAGVGAGALALYNYSRPAKERVGVGDKVFVSVSEGSVQSAMKLEITKVTPTHVTGEAYEVLPGLARPIMTVPRESVLSFV